jgi:hypothetical protein
MSEIMCHYSGNRDQAIVSYLYGDDAEFDRKERAAFEEHLATCDPCRAELAALDGVRASLGGWSPPGFESILRARHDSRAARRHELPSTGHPPAPISKRPWWREVPVWAQTAAALLCVAAGIGMANLDVQYDESGIRVRTGWLAAPTGDAASQGSAAPWRGELAALEARLRDDLRQASIRANPTNVSNATAGNAVSPETVRRIRTLVDESERRQQRELALRLAEAMRDVNAQRQADLVKIDRNIGAVQSSTGLEMLRQRNEMLVRTASQRAR